MSSENKNPCLIISNYFDSLIRQIDIYTEETLIKHGKDVLFQRDKDDLSFSQQGHRDINVRIANDVVDFETLEDINQLDSSKIFASIFENCKMYFHSNYFDRQPPCQPSMSAEDYINQKREELIEKLEKAQKTAFDYYKTIKNNKLKSYKNMSTEEIKSELFANNYYVIFCMKKESKREWETPFRLHLVKLDFYLTSKEYGILR